MKLFRRKEHSTDAIPTQKEKKKKEGLLAGIAQLSTVFILDIIEKDTEKWEKINQNFKDPEIRRNTEEHEG